jgi:hypothetical protein
MSVTNRVWDPTAVGFVYWRTGTPDVNGAAYPGPALFGATSDYTVVRGVLEQAPVEPQLHDLTHNPVGLWQFDGDMTDSSPTGENFTVATGSELYGTGIVPGTKAFYFNGSTRIHSGSPAPAALRITGDMTVEFLIKPDGLDTDTFGAHIIGCSGIDNSVAEVDNFLWHFRLSDAGPVDNNHPVWFWEGPASTFHVVKDVTFTVPPLQWSHVACVRINGGAGATIGRIYVNGELVVEVTTLDEATGGSSGRVKMGDTDTGGNDGSYFGHVQSVKVIPSALTAAQVLAEARLTLPPSVRP